MQLLLWLLLVAFGLHKILGYDVWWQLKTGEWILSHGIPRVDPFSFGFPGREWIEMRWLYCVAIHLLASAFGLNALILFKLALLAAAFGLTLGVGRPSQRWASLLGAGLVLVAAQDRLMVRPELFTFAALALTLFCLERFRRESRLRWILLLLPLQLLWTNTHTLWILGPAVLWIVVCVELAQSRLAPDSGRGQLLSREAWRSLAVITAVTSLISLANPYLLRGVAFPFRLFAELGSGHPLGRSIAEFESPFSSGLRGWDHRTLGAVAVALISCGSFLLHRRRVPWSRVALWGAFGLLALRAQRNVALFGFVAGYATILNLTECFETRRNVRMRRRVRAAALIAVTLYCVLTIPQVVTNRFYRSQRSDREFGFGVSDKRYPVRALRFIEEYGLPGPLLHTLGDGGYILYKLGESGVYIDGRLEVYGGKILARTISMTSSGEGLQGESLRLGAQTIVVRNQIKHRRLQQALQRSPDWVPVYYDHLHQVYLAVTDSTGAMARRMAIDWNAPVAPSLMRPAELDPPDWLAGLWPKVGDGFVDERLGSHFVSVGNIGRAQEHFERALAADRGNLRANLHLGLIYRALGRESEAEQLLGRIPRSLFERADSQTLAGELQMWANRPEAALESFRRAVEFGAFGLEHTRRVARAAIASRQYDLAERVLREALDAAPESIEEWNLLGAMELRRGRPQQAREALGRSLAIDPDQPRIRSWIEALPDPVSP